MVPNAEENLVNFARSKLTGEARRCIMGNYYNNLEHFISKLKTIFAPSKTVYRLQGVLGRIYRVRHIKCYRAITLKLLIISKNVSDKSFSVREGRHIGPPYFFISGGVEATSRSTPLF